MEAFRTEVPIPEFPFHIGHSDHITLLGSCFSEEMGILLDENKFQTNRNPFGIVFNPFSIMNALERMLNGRPYVKEELLPSGDLWASLDHHSSFDHEDPDATLDRINTALRTGTERLRASSVLFITLGSAWVYDHNASGRTVANCHRIPGNAFTKRLLTQQEVHLILRHIPSFLASKGLDLKIIFTVSPVRHWKDGAIENQRSKAQLLSAVHQVVEEFDQCFYFSAYEIMMDDLRDYRFYGSDMLHPNPQAIAYIWERFQLAFFNDETRIICQELKGVIQAASHRPVDPESNSFQRFIRKQVEIIDVLKERYPAVDLSEERKRFEAYRL